MRYELSVEQGYGKRGVSRHRLRWDYRQYPASPRTSKIAQASNPRGVHSPSFPRPDYGGGAANRLLYQVRRLYVHAYHLLRFRS